MKLLSTLAILAVALGFTFSLNAQNQWITDNEMQFKINVPGSYKQNQFTEGTDKILALVSPDENVAVRVRAMKTNDNLTTDLLQQVFEGNIINGASRIMNKQGDLHGIPANLAGYTWKYNNIETVIGAYYIVQNGFAYIVWTIVPQKLLNQRSAEADAIIESFTLLDRIKDAANALAFSNQNSKISLTSIVTGAQITNSYFIENPVSSFSQNTPQINVGFAYSGSSGNLPFQIKWFSKQFNRYFFESTLTGQNVNGGHGYSFITNQGNQWPAGSYQVEIWHDNMNIGSTEFQIF